MITALAPSVLVFHRFQPQSHGIAHSLLFTSSALRFIFVFLSLSLVRVLDPSSPLCFYVCLVPLSSISLSLPRSYLSGRLTFTTLFAVVPKFDLSSFPLSLSLLLSLYLSLSLIPSLSLSFSLPLPPSFSYSLPPTVTYTRD